MKKINFLSEAQVKIAPAPIPCARNIWLGQEDPTSYLIAQEPTSIIIKDAYLYQNSGSGVNAGIEIDSWYSTDKTINPGAANLCVIYKYNIDNSYKHLNVNGKLFHPYSTQTSACIAFANKDKIALATADTAALVNDTFSATYCEITIPKEVAVDSIYLCFAKGTIPTVVGTATTGKDGDLYLQYKN